MLFYRHVVRLHYESFETSQESLVSRYSAIKKTASSKLPGADQGFSERDWQFCSKNWGNVKLSQKLYIWLFWKDKTQKIKKRQDHTFWKGVGLSLKSPLLVMPWLPCSFPNWALTWFLKSHDNYLFPSILHLCSSRKQISMLNWQYFYPRVECLSFALSCMCSCTGKSLFIKLFLFVLSLNMHSLMAVLVCGKTRKCESFMKI